MDPNPTIKGCGAQMNVPNRFLKVSHERRKIFLNSVPCKVSTSTMINRFISNFYLKRL